MLKSHLQIQRPTFYEDDEPEETKPIIKFKAVPPEQIEPREPAAPVGRPLLKSEVSIRLSMIGKTAEGDGYTYLKAVCTNMDLIDIKALISFKHLQYIDVSNNKLTLDNLQVLTKLPYLLFIRADMNVIQSAGLRKMKYLQVMVLNNNKIKAVNDVFQPELSTLEVAFNHIDTIEFDRKMPQIKCLDFRNNKIKGLENMDFPNLDSLYLAGNKIKSLVGIDSLVNLRILHLRNNPIKKLDGFSGSLKKLSYLNLRSCKVTTFKQVKKLRVLPTLDTLIMKGCPYMGGTGEETKGGAEEEDESEMRIEALATLPRLKRLNKAKVTDEEKTEAKELMLLWLEEGEPDKDEEEQEEEEELRNEMLEEHLEEEHSVRMGVE